MEMQNKRSKALSVVTAAILAASLGAPATAVAEEDGRVVVAQESVSARAEAATDSGSVAAPEVSVAQACGKQYATLSQAIAEAPSGSTITMITDATISGEGERVCGKALTLDLAGHRIDADTVGAASAFVVDCGGSLTLVDSSAGQGVLSSPRVTAVEVKNGSYVMQGGNIESNRGIEVGYSTVSWGDLHENGSAVCIEGGVIKAEYCGVIAHGSQEGQGVSVSVSGGEVIGGSHGIRTWPSAGGGVGLTVTGGIIEATNGEGLFLANSADVAEVTDGVVKGKTGVRIEAGKLSVLGKAAVSGTTREFEENFYGNDSLRVVGCGIAVAQGATKAPVSVAISGSPVISGVYGLRESNPWQNAPEHIEKVSIRIESGTFDSEGPGYGGAAIESADCKGIITGGRYNTVPSADLIAEGYVAVVGKDGMVSIASEADAASCAKVGDKQYATLSQAIAEVPSGSTITMIADATLPAGGEKVFGKALTIDLNGKRIDASGGAFAIDRSGSMVLDDSSGGRNGAVYVSRGQWGGREVPGIAVGVGRGSFVMKGGTIESVDDGLHAGPNALPDWHLYSGESFAEVQGGVIRGGRLGICAQGGKERRIVSVLVSGGVVEGETAGVMTNGMLESAPYGFMDGGVKLAISGGTVKATGQRGIGVCVPGVNGSTEIAGGIIEGKTGVEIGAGELSISGDAVIEGTGPFSEEPRTSINNDGRNRITGCGIAVAQEMTKAPVSVAVSGSPVISGVYGLRESNLQQNAPEDIAKVDIRIEGGTFSSTDPASGAALESADCKGVAAGGRYSVSPSAGLIAEGYVAQAAEDGMTEVVPAPGPGPAPEPGPAPGPDPEAGENVEQRPDGSTVTTVTQPDGSQTVTTESADGTESVVSKDAEGNVTSVEVAVSEEAARAGEVVLPLEPSKPAVDPAAAPAVEVKAPASVTAQAPVKVTVPVEAAEGPCYGVVVYAVDADGNETLLPKCGVDVDGNAVFEITGDVTVKVVDASPSFPDTAGEWYGEDGTADFVGARGILTGVPQADGALAFVGDAATTRAMFATMLHRAESCPDAAGAGFVDAAGMWFEEAANWGEAAGVVDGYGGSVFGGEDPVTREQMAVFLMRYADHLGLDVSKRADLSAFPDGAEASAWASQAMSWAVAEGLFSGRDGRLDPTDGATRAEASAVVMCFINGLYA